MYMVNIYKYIMYIVNKSMSLLFFAGGQPQEQAMQYIYIYVCMYVCIE
jgi:hypothetical protein